MPETIIDLGKKVKAKYPGQYDDLDDADVGKKVKAKFPGAYDDFIDAPAAETKQPSVLDLLRGLVGGNPDVGKGLARAAGRIGMGAVQWAEDIPRQVGLTDKNLVSPTPISLEPSLNPFQHFGEEVGRTAAEVAPAVMSGGASVPVQTAVGATLGGVASESPTGAVVGGAIPYAAKSAGNVLERLKASIPSKASAGAKFQQVMAAAKDVPLDTSAADEAVARAQELRTRGSSMPKVLNDFVKNRKSALADFMGVQVPEPMTYEVGRDFASNAGALSSREATALNAKMQRQVAEFANAMKTANREAAAKVGMGDLYDQAMKEYARAANAQEAAKVLKKWASNALVRLAVGGGAGYALYRSLHD